jgi:hypothetical protein
MTRRFLRLFAAALLALILPLQGMASVIGGQCMAFGHHQEGTAGHGSHGEGATHDEAAHDEGHDHAAHSHAEGPPAQDHGDDKSPHCGPCTACCASASIAGPAAAFSISSLPSDVAYVFTQSPPPSVQLDELDRPPLPL